MTTYDNFVFENTDMTAAKQQSSESPEEVCITLNDCYVIVDMPDSSKKYSCKRARARQNSKSV